MSLALIVGSILCVTPSALHSDEVFANAESTKPLKAGAAAPDASLRTLDGKSILLSEVSNGKKTALIFYRGGWCPFCNTHLKELAVVEEDLKNMGFQIVALSPDTPESIAKMLGKTKVSYTLLSDSKAEATKRFGIAFRVDDNTFSMYRDRFRLDLEKESGESHHILPVPSVFLIDGKRQIRYAYSNPDYKVRLKGADILTAAKGISN
ncbi:MAG TPA: peroxiredoxin-like family protein [Fimbriimonadaceae bacterium]|nr:peroxiredoxin-like family protein [Fimbriimonadaceae bacterium]